MGVAPSRAACGPGRFGRPRRCLDSKVRAALDPGLGDALDPPDLASNRVRVILDCLDLVDEIGSQPLDAVDPGSHRTG